MSYLNFNGKQISTMALNPPLSNKNNETDIVNGYIDQENNFELNYNTGINIKFQDIVYSIRRHILWDRSTKTILNGINGEFRAGQLTAILGPSGAGKSTLLDILTGYITKFTSGTITANGRQCKNLKIAYIIQDCQLHRHITVLEAMFFAMSLKVGAQLKCDEKKERIKQILDVIGLHEQRHTKTGQLSGGQRKRLTIALELVDDPQIMIFDEPTSGLDSSTSVLVISLLKQLADEGRTIICSIHQPSVRLYNLFDHLYAIADGQCFYSGSTEMLIPFLSELDLICPKTYDPFDYLLEISTNEYGLNNQRLVAKIQNGSNESYRKKMKNLPPCAIGDSDQYPKPSNRITYSVSGETDFHRQPTETYATSFWRQWYLLTVRMIRCFSRDWSLGVIRLTVHFFVALVVGSIYINIGDDAGQTLINYRFIFAMLMFFMHTAFCSMTILFPIEMPIVAREHFNRWYSAKAYYFALTFTDFPMQFACVSIYVSITYVMTGQPLELFRFIYILTMATLLALVSQSIGMIVGAAFGVKLSVIIGPFLQAPPLIFSGFFVHLTDAPANLHWLFYWSYLRYALEGSVDSIFGYSRPKLQCNEMYCHYQIPAKFIKEVDMQRNDFYSAFTILLAILVCLRAIAYAVIEWRLKRK